MSRALHHRASSAHPVRILLLAFGIDVIPALIFIYRVIALRFQLNDVDVERTLFLFVIPIFNGLNFLLILTLYFFLARSRIPLLIFLILPIIVALLTYPALFVAAFFPALFDLKYPQQEISALHIFTISGWLMSTVLGLLGGGLYLLRRSSQAN